MPATTRSIGISRDVDSFHIFRVSRCFATANVTPLPAQISTTRCTETQRNRETSPRGNRPCPPRAAHASANTLPHPYPRRTSLSSSVTTSAPQSAACLVLRKVRTPLVSQWRAALDSPCRCGNDGLRLELNPAKPTWYASPAVREPSPVGTIG